MSAGPPKAFPGDLAWNESSLLSYWIVGPLYGDICVFALCAHVLNMKGLKGSNLLMLIVAATQFSLATAHIITILVQMIRGFISAADTPGGTIQYLLSQSNPEHICQSVFYITNSLIGDAILIWRLWVIWNRNFWLTFPFILLCIASTITGYTALAHLATLPPNGSVFTPSVHNWLIATWVLSIATQFGATLLIGYRFWITMLPNSKGIRASRLSILWILVESGALYSVTTIFLLGFSSTNTGALFASSLGQISALAPTLIIVRAGLKSGGSSFTPAKGSINNSYHTPAHHAPRGLGHRHHRDNDSVVVHVRKATEICLDDYTTRERDGEVSSAEEMSGALKP
ncbi:hypothetical protein BGW80DRAFT_862892 [Lactifluus volemus]|nr:hypothetical protein BGW80DRAFT_862892 [Lactifluus volemus]